MREYTSIDSKQFTTFGVHAIVSHVVEFDTCNEIVSAIGRGLFRDKPMLVMGGGSNLLFCSNFEGTIIKPCIKGIEIIEKNENYAIVEAGAGEVWDDLVAFAVRNELYGLENLSYIPGTVGASPVQNIGAYGVEVQQSIQRVEVLDLQTGDKLYFTNQECNFDYRDSIFKQQLKGKYIVTKVRYTLSCQKKFVLDYKDIREYLKNETTITLQKVRDAVIAIRKNKLPNPAEVGNAGSFFKNPIISDKQFASLQTDYPTIAHYVLTNGMVKLAAGWLIEKAGFKGFRRGDAGVHPLQALVLVNYGNASGNEIAQLAHDIQSTILNTFGVTIHPEVNLV